MDFQTAPPYCANSLRCSRKSIRRGNWDGFNAAMFFVCARSNMPVPIWEAGFTSIMPDPTANANTIFRLFFVFRSVSAMPCASIRRRHSTISDVLICRISAPPSLGKEHFELYLKECEWRFNNSEIKVQSSILKQLVKHDLS